MNTQNLTHDDSEYDDAPFGDIPSYGDEGHNAYFSGAKNPHPENSYAWKEWERAYISISKRESRCYD